MINLFLFNDCFSNNTMIYSSDNIITFLDFKNFLSSKAEYKAVLLPENYFIKINKTKCNLLEYLSFLSQYVDDIRHNNIKFVIDISTGGLSTSYYKDILNLVRHYNLNPNDVYILINTKFEYDIFDKLSKEFDIHVKLICTNRNEILFFEDLFFYERNKKFLFLCRRFTTERLIIFLDLHRRKILENSFYSFTFERNPYATSNCVSMDVAEDWLLNFIEKTACQDVTNKKLLLEYWKDNKEQIFKNSPYWIGNNNIQVQHDASVAEKFNDSYISLCVETEFSMDKFHFQPSEKIYKCCYFRHPFVVYSTPNFLESWNKTGYKSFDNIINEKYDKEVDDLTRIFMINDEIEKLNNLPFDDFIKNMHLVQNTLNHNQRLLTEKFLGPKQKNLYKNDHFSESFLRDNYRIHYER